MRKKVFSILFAIIISLAIFKGYLLISEQKLVLINGNVFMLEVANSPEERTKGLSGHKAFSNSRGMLFEFDQETKQVFWMKEMLFDLDFLWISGNEIVKVDENVPAPERNEQPAVVQSGAVINKVIEINSGLIQEYDIEVGDRIVSF